MKEIIVITKEELEEIIDNCFARYLPKLIEPVSMHEQKLLFSIQELSDFLCCSVVTAHHLKKSGRIRYRQYGRKCIFNTSEIMEDLEMKSKIRLRKYPS